MRVDSSSTAPLTGYTPFQTLPELTPNGLPHVGARGALEASSQLLGQTSWLGTPTPMPTVGSMVGGSHPSMNLGFQHLNLQYFPATVPPALGSYAIGEGGSHVWGSSPSGGAMLGSQSEHHGAKHDSPGKQEKVKKKRGRPRLYDDDGTERPKRKPGRPPMYVVSDAGSSTSPLQVIRSVSTASDSSSALAPTWSQLDSQGPEMATSRDASSRKSKGKAKEKPASIGEGDDEEEDDEEARRQEVIRARNKTAASRYRAKTQAAIAIMEAEERDVSSRRQALIACATQLKEEVYFLKNEILRQAECGCPLITGYLAEATQLAYSPTSSGAGRTGSISSGMENMALSGDVSRIAHCEGCSERAGGFGGPAIDGDGSRPGFF
ncbi:hypothetical protein QBC34DRAFT_400899 [Podospora aff. communis PSN243]|uniref:BZIP domain-containing protein n=1 Tax=Podospora aff. communis PSN243 TaxID=3040156 RepID=A0AAV9GUS8_9PEZI|nr:hypothetical protein QBC34DRAFT_400899 [Podospora aff. communis PSN243]